MSPIKFVVLFVALVALVSAQEQQQDTNRQAEESQDLAVPEQPADEQARKARGIGFGAGIGVYGGIGIGKQMIFKKLFFNSFKLVKF